MTDIAVADSADTQESHVRCSGPPLAGCTCTHLAFARTALPMSTPRQRLAAGQSATPAKTHAKPLTPAPLTSTTTGRAGSIMMSGSRRERVVHRTRVWSSAQSGAVLLVRSGHLIHTFTAVHLLRPSLSQHCTTYSPASPSHDAGAEFAPSADAVKERLRPATSFAFPLTCEPLRHIGAAPTARPTHVHAR
jgi:hypothetical protein